MGFIVRDEWAVKTRKAYTQLSTVPQYELTEVDLKTAKDAAEEDQEYNRRVGAKPHGSNDPKVLLRQTQLGYCGEIAVCAWFTRITGIQCDWKHEPGNYKARDVLGYQVRTRPKVHYGLNINPHDRPDDIFILCKALRGPQGEPIIYIIGWRTAKDVMENGDKRDSKSEGHFYTIDTVKPLDTLPMTPERLQHEQSDELPF